MKDRLGDFLQTVITALIAASVAVCAYRCHQEPPEGPETVVETRVDTLVVRDTIRAYKPVPFNVYVVDTLYVPVPVPGGRDTVWAQLPREAKEYRDPDTTYWAVVSGVEPRLDSIEVYPKTVFIEKAQTVFVEPSPWSVGLQAGVGASKDGVSPYVGIGVQYRLWAPKRRKAPP